MPPSNILLLALLGGFIFVSLWYPTKYYTLRVAGYRLVFATSIAAALFLAISSCITVLLPAWSFVLWIDQTWHEIVPPTTSGKAALAFFFGIALWWPLNRIGNWSHKRQGKLSFLSEQAAADRAINIKRDPLELFLREALGSKRPICVTLRTGQVYIGHVQSSVTPASPLNSMHLYLTQRGHTQRATGSLMVDADYTYAIQELKDSLKASLAEAVLEGVDQYPDKTIQQIIQAAKKTVNDELQWRRFQVVIPVREITSISPYTANTNAEPS